MTVVDVWYIYMKEILLKVGILIVLKEILKTMFLLVQYWIELGLLKLVIFENIVNIGISTVYFKRIK